MLAAALLVCVAPALLPAQDLEAVLTASAAEAAIGEPVEWTLTVHHDRDESLRLLQQELAPDASWVQVAGPRTARERLDDRAWTTVRWTLLSLEPGERELPVPTFELTSGAAVTSTPGRLVVRGELAPDEDAPRAFADLHAAPPRSGGWRTAAWLLLGAWFLGSALTTVLIVRGGRRASAPVHRAADALRALAAPAPRAQRAWIFDYATLLRAACDEALATPRAGLTDEEWLARYAEEGRLPDDVLGDVRDALARAADVKYGGLELTSFALDELRQVAASVLERLPAGDAEGPA